jgi:uncharacterized protein YbaP (TraB family)
LRLEADKLYRYFHDGKEHFYYNGKFYKDASKLPKKVLNQLNKAETIVIEFFGEDGDGK